MFAAMITSIPALTLALFMAEVKQKPAYEMLDDRIVSNDKFIHCVGDVGRAV